MPEDSRGFTIIELLIATFIIGVVVVALFGLFILSLRMAAEGERQVIGIALANERMEMIRNLPYANVGTQGGVPSGSIPQTEQITRNQMTFTVTTNIEYVDDPFDGLAPGNPSTGKVTICHKPGTPAEATMEVPPSAVNAHLSHGDTISACAGGGTPPSDVYNADYKQARVEVLWSWPQGQRSVLLVSIIAPPGYEGSEAGGTLDFYVMDANGNSIQSTTVTLRNDSTNPAIDLTTQTNEEGRLVLPGLPVSSQSYELSVSKTNYTSESTYDITSSFIPDTEHMHLSSIQGELTSKIFLIDRSARLTVNTRSDSGVVIPNISYHLRGTKTIGVDGSGNPVYKTDVSDQTGAAGTDLQENLEWDSYSFSIDGIATGYDIKETSRQLPLLVNPGDDIDLTVTLVPHTPISLQVTVLDGDGNAVDKTALHLTGNGVDATLETKLAGQVLFANLPINGDYTLDADAPGYSPSSQTVSVSDTSFSSLTLVASP